MKRWLAAERGATLVEVAVVLAIIGILLPSLASIVAGLVRIPVKTQSELIASQGIQNAVLAITEDANMAQSFTPGVEPDYGTFTWHEFSGASPVEVTARYYWADQQVFRALDRRTNPLIPEESRRVVVDGVLQYADVVFQRTPSSWTYDPVTRKWTYAEGKVTVSVKTTQEAGAEFPDTVFTAQLLADLRPQIDRPVPLPGRLAPPVPPPNQVNFRIAGNPNLITGTYRSGSGADLRYDDTSYYVTRGAGTPRIIVWEATSEAIDYSTITDINVEFTGLTDKAGVSLEFFIFNPSDPEHTSGYASSPDAASIYASANTDVTTVFAFGAQDVAYVNSLATKVVKFKLKATLSTVFDLSADKLVFKVAGTPAATFSRDYILEVTPSLEAGSFVGGDFTSLGTDDTSYYTVQEVAGVVRWSVVSEPISLDTISSIEVRFIGRATRGAPVQQLFVFNPANGGDGYPLTPNSQNTYASTNTDTLVSFFLISTDREYVKSLFPKEVRIRIKGTDSTTNWQLQGDLLLFRVKP
ncbi:MAG: type II secretion system protein [Chloroflexota bacterium]|nr:type II secretion system protein [Chloroflexota bacterium]